MGRRKGSKSPASRENGKKGGRPGSRLPPELYEQLGPPPIESPIKLARWYTSALALCLDMRLRGVSSIDRLAKEVRASAAAAGRVLPHDIIFSAARVVRDDEDELAADGGPQEQEVERPAGERRACRLDA